MSIELIMEIVSTVLGVSGVSAGSVAVVKHKKTQNNNVELENRLTRLETIQQMHEKQFKSIDRKLDKIFDMVRKPK